MRAVAKRVGRKPEIIEIENTLKALQEFVGGYIEVVRMHSGNVIICNEEGILRDKVNFRYNENWFFGDILVCGVDGEEFCDVKKHSVICQQNKPNCPCNTCENDDMSLFSIGDEWNPCCHERKHRKPCDCNSCRDYKKESPAGAEQKEN